VSNCVCHGYSNVFGGVFLSTMVKLTHLLKVIRSVQRLISVILQIWKIRIVTIVLVSCGSKNILM